MLERVVTLFVTVIEWLHVKAERLGVGVRTVLAAVALAAVGATVGGAVLVAASGFVLWSLFLAMEASMSTAWAALSVALVVWLGIGGATWLLVRRLRRS